MTSPRTAVVVFPGSNCDRDNVRSWRAVTGLEAELVWHKETSLPDYDLIIVPGGFSFGDYLRCGAIARFSPVMSEVARLAARGSLVLGICNGFQILTEARLLPGALTRNRDLKYICKDVTLRVENASSAFTSRYAPGQVLRIPVSHGEGGWSASLRELKELQDQNRVVFRYCAPDGSVSPQDAPNGSLDNIAGVLNERGNVMGLMPHPERLAEEILGGVDGRGVFLSLLEAASGGLKR
ncbi:MAG: phosphoribosylformylglycinamidine synthase subunit PurQ [Deltaproteobacteria bacterium]|jgi:phosphoribosylformylglycinamidine synthase|nr:phosphoribosylformylglycinamidine synthase subunit PurQ [Deltaproteobacteria bacterium]